MKRLPPKWVALAPASASRLWCWLALLSPLPLLLFSLGAPLGEPVADDFDYLHHVMFAGPWAWLDGGGSAMYWRPISHQAYFALLRGLLLMAPIWVSLIHTALLSVAAYVLYDAVRPRTSGVVAFSIASFPLLMESSRMLVAWPSNFQDLGALLFIAVSLHAVSRGRLPVFLASALGAVLCKEIGAIGVAFALVCPGIAPPGWRGRPIWAAALTALLLTWAITYRWVFVHAPLVLTPMALPVGQDAAMTWLHRYLSVIALTLRATLSLPRIAMPVDVVAFGSLAALVLAIENPARLRAAVRLSWRWLVWGICWFLVFSLMLAVFYPSWEPYRCTFVVLGLGAAVSVFLAAIRPWLPIALVLLRLGLLAVAPGPALAVRSAPDEAGASIDLPKLTRLQLLTRSIRLQLKARFPKLPSGGRVVQHNFPVQSTYALEGSRALQVWYGDSTLRWVPFTSWQASKKTEAITIVEFQNVPRDPIALVSPHALRRLLAATHSLEEGRWATALGQVDSVTNVDSSVNATMFRGSVEAKRALALVGCQRFGEAEAAARRARALSPWDRDAHLALAISSWRAGRLPDATTQLDTVSWLFPHDAAAERLSAAIRTHRPMGVADALGIAVRATNPGD